MLKDLCKIYVHRATSLGLKGKRRDNDLIAFMVGAAQALELANLKDDASNIGTVTSLVLSVRGYAEVENIAAKE